MSRLSLTGRNVSLMIYMVLRNFNVFAVPKIVIIFVIAMNFKTNLPEIATLRSRVKAKIGLELDTHFHFVQLVAELEKCLREHMSETTLERVWGYSTRGYDTVSRRTLDVLSRYVGAKNWDDFCELLRQEKGRESDLFLAKVIMSQSLEVGTRLLVGWQPDRLCEIEYLGNNRFVALRTENSSIKPGDKFSCLLFEKGRELYMDLFQRAAETGDPNPNARYVVGQQNGLTTLEIIKTQP